MTSIEKRLERRLSKEIKRRGGYFIKLLPFLETGLPDRMAVLPDGVVIFVELKSGGRGVLKGKQLLWRNRLLETGQEHWVIFDEKSYLRFLRRLDKL